MLEKKYRKELKYVINQNDKLILEERLKTLVEKDKHTKEDGTYTIISLYFDDYNETSYNQVINGISERWKWRIRYYNYNSSYICLEKKYKHNGLNKKYQIKLTKKQVEDIISLKNIQISKDNPKLLNEFYLNIFNKIFRPKIIIIYDRIPFVYKAGNVRITIDYNLAFSNEFDNFFNKRIKLIPVLEPNQAILEIKYDNFIPDFIRYKLELNHLNQTSFSKYYQSINLWKTLYKF